MMSISYTSHQNKQINIYIHVDTNMHVNMEGRPCRHPAFLWLSTIKPHSYCFLLLASERSEQDTIRGNKWKSGIYMERET